MMGSIYFANSQFSKFLQFSSKWDQMYQVVLLVLVGCLGYGVFIYLFDKRDIKEVMGRS
jgi:hypothetical protein